MNAKYRPPAIASDQYAFLKIGARAIRTKARCEEHCQIWGFKKEWRAFTVPTMYGLPKTLEFPEANTLL